MEYCQWENCGYKFLDMDDVHMHLMFHVHHVKLKLQGIEVIGPNSRLYECTKTKIDMAIVYARNYRKVCCCDVSDTASLCTFRTLRSRVAGNLGCEAFNHHVLTGLSVNRCSVNREYIIVQEQHKSIRDRLRIEPLQGDSHSQIIPDCPWQGCSKPPAIHHRINNLEIREVYAKYLWHMVHHLQFKTVACQCDREFVAKVQLMDHLDAQCLQPVRRKPYKSINCREKTPRPKQQCPHCDYMSVVRKCFYLR